MSRRMFVPRYSLEAKMQGTNSQLKITIVLCFLIGSIEAPKGATVTDLVYWRLTNFLELDPCNSISFMWITQAQAKEHADGLCATIFNAGWMKLDHGSREICAGAENPRCVDLTQGKKVVHPSQQKWSCQVDIPASCCQIVFCGVKNNPVDLQYCVRGVKLVRSDPTENTPLLG